MNIMPDELFILDGFSPEFQICHTSTKSSDLNEMLKETIMIVQSVELSVKDTVKYIANVDGGVHSGEPKLDKEIIISKIAASIDDATVYQRSIKGIAKL